MEEKRGPARFGRNWSSLRDMNMRPRLFVILCMLSVAAVGGDPILGPDLKTCKFVIPRGRTEDDAVDCCFADTTRPIVDFQFNPNLPMRVRRPAHKLDNEFVRKYQRAYEIMRSLPAEDPRSWTSQANIHCAYCGGAYYQQNARVPLRTHRSWLFFPYHRWYMYFHERILASLIGDDTFAIPYWAWDVQNQDSPPANSMPRIYTNKSSSLYDEYRSARHQPPKRADLTKYTEEVRRPTNLDPSILTEQNMHIMWSVMIDQLRVTEAFAGGKYHLGDDPELLEAGLLEHGPHAVIHRWTGDETMTNGEDMSPAYSAARDPIFYAHHSQVDRLWLLWTSMGGTNFDDSDWLQTEFLFYDENSNMVRVNISDSLSLDKLRIQYELEPVDWMDYLPSSIRQTNPKYARKGMSTQLWSTIYRGFDVREMFRSMLGTSEGDAKLLKGSNTLTLRVSRPDARARSSIVLKTGAKASVLEEVLVIEGIMTKPFDVDLSMKIFLDLPEADQSTPVSCAESIGTFSFEEENGGRESGTIARRRFSRKIGIGGRFPLLGISDQSKSVDITFVPAWESIYDNDVQFQITHLKVELRGVR